MTIEHLDMFSAISSWFYGDWLWCPDRTIFIGIKHGLNKQSFVKVWENINKYKHCSLFLNSFNALWKGRNRQIIMNSVKMMKESYNILCSNCEKLTQQWTWSSCKFGWEECPTWAWWVIMGDVWEGTSQLVEAPVSCYSRPLQWEYMCHVHKVMQTLEMQLYC